MCKPFLCWPLVVNVVLHICPQSKNVRNYRLVGVSIYFLETLVQLCQINQFVLDLNQWVDDVWSGVRLSQTLAFYKV